ncbi:MAG: 4Fe-4S binding protein [Peptococcaceae bacterium]|jgi:ferredoxin|nr:4Fe-4S binding protein [Peptococcaceae bacterium]
MRYQAEKCLNTKQTYAYPCRMCLEICPHGAMTGHYEISEERCTECGLCVAVCPSGGMADPLARAFEQYLFSERTERLISCPQAAEPGDMEIPCLGILDRDSWSVLILLAQEQPVRLVTGDCRHCPDLPACAASVRVFQELHRDWPGHATVQIVVKPVEQETGESADGTPEAVRKKNGWSVLQKHGWNILKKAMKKPEEVEPATPYKQSRQWLLRMLADRPQAKVPFRALTATEQCTACGVCVSVCPQAALSEQVEGGTHLLILEPGKCVQCGRCQQVCRAAALDFTVKNLSERLLNGKVLIHEGQVRSCVRCGRYVYNDSDPALCVICASARVSE